MAADKTHAADGTTSDDDAGRAARTRTQDAGRATLEKAQRTPEEAHQQRKTRTLEIKKSKRSWKTTTTLYKDEDDQEDDAGGRRRRRVEADEEDRRQKGNHVKDDEDERSRIAAGDSSLHRTG